jgi:hydrogenase nickel incorporation protein HypA/HybF
MHEMSIALSIIDLASEQAVKAKAEKIKEIELDIGTLSGIELESLNFALEVAVGGTLLEKSIVKINSIEAESECLECGLIFKSLNLINACPSCKELNTKIIRGREMQLKSLLIE